MEGTRVGFLSTDSLSLPPIQPPLRPSPRSSSSDRFEHGQTLTVAGLSLSLQGSWVPSNSSAVHEHLFFCLKHSWHFIGCLKADVLSKPTESLGGMLPTLIHQLTPLSSLAQTKYPVVLLYYVLIQFPTCC